VAVIGFLRRCVADHSGKLGATGAFGAPLTLS
jgi:hypothetical protein